MTPNLRTFRRTVCSLAALLALAACGGGTAEPPPDTVAPTLAITDSETGDVAAGAVTFTFTFSEDVGDSFTAEDVAVTGGSAGTLTKVSATHYTMVVTPPANSSGTLAVSVATAKYSDLALNANTAAASAAQAYSNAVAAPSDALISWDEATSPVSGIGAYGDAGPTVETAPAGGSGNALKITRSGAQTFGGTYFTVAPALPFTTANKTVTARVQSTRAGAVIKLKVEVPGGASVEVAATQPIATANTWQTLTWNLAGVDPSLSYTVIAISPDVDIAIGGAQSYWFDNLKIVATQGSTPSGAAAVFSAGFSANGLTANGGAFGGFSGSNQDSFNCDGAPDHCGSGGGFSGDAASYYYYYYQTATPATALYTGMYILAPGVTAFNNAGDTSGVAITTQTKLNFTLNQNPEWFNGSTNNFMIVMDLGKLYSAGGGACRLQLRRVVTPTSAAATAYSIPLSSFKVVQNCATPISTVAAALAVSPISQISFQGVGGSIALDDGVRTSGANLGIATPDGKYPTTLAVTGAITFD